MIDDVENLYNEFKSFNDLNIKFKDNIIIPTKFKLLNYILNGGFKNGLITITGESSGKSTLMTQIIAYSQLYFKSKIIIIYLDLKSSETNIRLLNLGVKYKILKPYCNKLLLTQVFDFIDLIHNYKIKYNKINIPVMIIVDSISDYKKMNNGKYLSLISRYISKCLKYNIWLFIINNYNISGLDMFATHNIKMNKIICNYNFINTELIYDKNVINLIGSINNGFSDFLTNYLYLKNNNKTNSSELYSEKYNKIKLYEIEKIYNSDNNFRNNFNKEFCNFIINRGVINE